MKTSRFLQTLFSLIFLLVVLSSCSGIDNKHKFKLKEQMQPLVNVNWLNEHLNDPDLVILDTTIIVKVDEKGGMSQISGQGEFDLGHIPNAGFADLNGNLSAPNNQHDFIMPTPEQFQKAMGELGVGKDSRVVLYSGQSQVWAARVWWMLRWAGFDQVSILDGGLKAWKNAGLPLSTEYIKRPNKSFPLALRPEVIADASVVMAAIKNDKVELIDAMPEAHYTGQFSMYARPGHISSAINVPSSSLFDENELYKPVDELEMMFKNNTDTAAISYCGGGIAASAVAFTLHRLGHKDVAVYMDSLQEWTAGPQNPMSTGNEKP